MKRILALVLVFLLAISAVGCQSTEPEETTQDTEPSTTEQPPQDTEPTQETTEPAPELAFEDYQYIHQDPRDLAWEEDIVYLAQMYLGEGPVKGHAAIVNEWYTVLDIDNYVTTRYFYDEALRDTFIAEIHELIAQVPEYSDDRINYELARIVALLGDAHTQVYTPDSKLFPLLVDRMEHEGQLGLYVTRIPVEHRDLIYGELTAINGVEIDEVCSRLAEYIPSENPYWAEACVYNVYRGCSLVRQKDLQAAGIMGEDEDTALFQIRKSSGETVEISLEALSIETEYWNVWYVDRTLASQGMLSMSRYGDCKYFGTQLSGSDAYYIRLHEMSEQTDYRLKAFLEDQNQVIRDMGGVERLVVDVRYNPGGHMDFVDDIVDYLREADARWIYILINDASFSGAVVFPQRASEKLENVTLVGTPAGQPPNFLAGSSSIYDLKKHDISFRISASYFEGSKDFEGDALMPDVLIYQNLEDYMKGVDTQLQAALEIELPEND